MGITTLARELPMTYHDGFTLSDALLEQLTTWGLDALPDLFRVLLTAPCRSSARTPWARPPTSARERTGAHGPRQRL